MSELPKVTTITSAYNSEKWIARAIEHLLAQTYPGIEILVIDAGSTDSTPEICRQYKINYVRTQHEPLYVTWNRGLRLATGNYCLMNASDDWIESECIGLMSGELDRHSEAVLVYTDSIIHHEDGHIDKAERPEYDKGKFRQSCLVGPCPMFRKELAIRLGGFDESMIVSADWKAWCAMSELGSFIHIPKFLQHYSLRKDGIEYSNRAKQIWEDGLIRMEYPTDE
jgi:glycosyltransferase involved in cell wall biosynthesis